MLLCVRGVRSWVIWCDEGGLMKKMMLGKEREDEGCVIMVKAVSFVRRGD